MALAEDLRAKSGPPLERLTVTMSGASRISDLGKRKLNQLVAEKRIESTLVDGRRLIYVKSLLDLLEAGRDVPPIEPPQLKRARLQKQIAE